MKKENFQAKSDNKHHFIKKKSLETKYNLYHAPADADFLIVQKQLHS